MPRWTPSKAQNCVWLGSVAYMQPTAMIAQQHDAMRLGAVTATKQHLKPRITGLILLNLHSLLWHVGDTISIVAQMSNSQPSTQCFLFVPGCMRALISCWQLAPGYHLSDGTVDWHHDMVLCRKVV
jgi:hypothetical protein